MFSNMVYLWKKWNWNWEWGLGFGIWDLGIKY